MRLFDFRINFLAKQNILDPENAFHIIISDVLCHFFLLRDQWMFKRLLLSGFSLSEVFNDL